ncbi:MAG: hypothetical protein M0042_12085 [Nitrospiraceae bacterium]|nr:hypothetical protein [Nitrospiraceae bacterium]
MKFRMIIAVCVISAFLPSCYFPIAGRVIDAETKQPIEGAVVLVEWVKKHGLWDPWPESYKVIEVVSDKSGKVKLGGCYTPFVEPPKITIYKKGYVGWNSHMIFPDQVRTNFTWVSFTAELELFKPEYSYIDHSTFIARAINAALNSENKQTMKKAYRWEELEASKERDAIERKWSK